MENEYEEDIVNVDADSHDESHDDEVDTTDWKAKAIEEEGRRKRLEKKLEKAKEQKLAEQEVKTSNELGGKDLFALVKAGVSEDDVDEVLEYAKFKNVSVTDALKSSVVSTMLREKAEMRRSAEVAYSGSGRTGTAKVTDETILKKAEDGSLSDDDIERLAAIRLKSR